MNRSSLFGSPATGLERLGRIIFLAVVGAILIIAAAGCAAMARHRTSQLYGPEHPVDRAVTAEVATASTVQFERDVRPILFNRCAVCHGCYDAPCQLKLTSFEGVDRGATKAKVYPTARLRADDPTRLYTDARSTTAWRGKGFFPVLNERDQSSGTNLQASILFRLLALKSRHPFPGIEAPDGEVDSHPIPPARDYGLWPETMGFGLSREEACPALDELDRYEEERPLQGMPFGLPPLAAPELQLLSAWLGTGAKGVPAGTADPAPKDRSALERWEQFLNADGAKQQLVSRYLFEHLFLANLHFSAKPEGSFYKLVRSRTAPGQPIDEIASRRPYDDPGVPRPYYRFRPEYEGIIAKTHLPYLLDDARLARYRSLFLDPQYEVDQLPSYSPEITSNPFKTFEKIPPISRYRFLLDEAQFAVMSFIKGPVCRGDRAVNVIDDRFWVFFVAPEKDSIAADGEFLSRQSAHLHLPAEAESNALMINWLSYARKQREYMEARSARIKEKLNELRGVDLDLIWNGDGSNTNAALTVFRHYDSATVVQGLVGEPPKTAWVMGYPLLERIHYLLVAGFDVYGNASHQLMTRLYMDFLRMEGEQNFLAFLPRHVRVAEREHWYRDVGRRTRNEMDALADPDLQDPAIEYRSGDPKAELFAMLRARLGNAHSVKFALPSSAPSSLRAIGEVRGIAASLMPEMSLVRVRGRTGTDALYTLLHDRAHLNVAVFYREDARLVPAEDSMTVVPGVLGAYPNAFFAVDEEQLGDFSARIGALSTPEDYRALVDRYGIRRSNPQFWAETDWFQQAYRAAEPVTGGLLDYYRLENR